MTIKHKEFSKKVASSSPWDQTRINSTTPSLEHCTSLTADDAQWEHPNHQAEAPSVAALAPSVEPFALLMVQQPNFALSATHPSSSPSAAPLVFDLMPPSEAKMAHQRSQGMGGQTQQVAHFGCGQEEMAHYPKEQERPSHPWHEPINRD